jgi:hypothetical protein
MSNIQKQSNPTSGTNGAATATAASATGEARAEARVQAHDVAFIGGFVGAQSSDAAGKLGKREGAKLLKARLAALSEACTQRLGADVQTHTVESAAQVLDAILGGSTSGN